MEAKVDIRKLQVLNDRINQTLDALQQVRLSVHGLGHVGPYPGINPMGYGQIGQPFGQQAFGQQPFGPGFNPLQQSYGVGFGLQHMSPWGVPQQAYGVQGFGQNPWSQGLTGQGFGGPGTSNPYSQGLGGLFHNNPDVIERTVLEARANDPTRISTTFPYALAPQSPILSTW